MVYLGHHEHLAVDLADLKKRSIPADVRERLEQSVRVMEINLDVYRMTGEYGVAAIETERRHENEEEGVCALR